jgi:hypothetical protein
MPLPALRWATGVWQAAHPRAGGYVQSQRIVERADYGLDALTGHETREAGLRGHRPNGLGLSCGRGRRTSPPGPSHLCAPLCPPRRRAKCSCRESRTIAWLPGAGKARPLRGASPLPVGVVLEPLRGPLSTALDKAQHRRARYIPATSSDLEGVVRDAYQWRAESARRIPSRRAVPSCVGPRSCPVGGPTS